MNPSTSTARCEDESMADELMDDWLFLSSGSLGPEVLEVSTDDQEAVDKGKLKSKLVSAWNSVKYSWSLKHKSKFSKSSPMIMFGKCYKLRDQEERECFRHAFFSLLWLTYRRGFSPLPGCALTTDSGWGCVLRTGQMLLARGLMLHLLPPDWTWSASHPVFKDDMDLESHPADTGQSLSPKKMSRTLSLGSRLDRPMEATHRQIVRWFADHTDAPFGLHRLVELGKSSGKKAGDWYGPSIVAHIIRKAVAASADPPDLVVYVAQDCTVYLGDVKKLCQQPPPHHTTSLIILVPVRLGGQDLNPAYIPCVKKLLMLKCCIGIIGGKPKHSLFFVGFQGDYLLYLDPHYCQATVDATKENFPLESLHCKYPRKMSFSRMDPSCTIGFYAKGQKDFESLCTAVKEVLSTSAGTYPMFIFAEGHSRGDEGSTAPTNGVAYIQRKKELQRVDTSSSLDEFVLL